MEIRRPVYYFLQEGGELVLGQEACTEQEARQKLRAMGVRGRLDLIVKGTCEGPCEGECRCG